MKGSDSHCGRADARRFISRDLATLVVDIYRMQSGGQREEQDDIMVHIALKNEATHARVKLLQRCTCHHLLH